MTAPLPAGVPAGSKESPELRRKDSRTYLLPDGDYRAQVSATALNYKDAHGLWQPIDNALLPESGGYRNSANSYALHLPSSLGDPVTVSKGGASASLTLLGAGGTASVSGARATYADALPNVDVSYTATNDSVKESLRLAGPVAPSSFSYSLKLSAGLSARLTSAGGIEIVKADGSSSFSLAPPNIRDASGTTSNAVSMTLAPNLGGYTITVVPDPLWLASSARAWPVTIDPTFYTTADTYIKDGSYANTNYSSWQEIYVGYDGTNKMRGLLQFDLSAIPSQAVVVGAQLQLYLFSMAYCTGCPAAPVEVHRVTQAYTSSTATWNKYDSTHSWGSAGGDYSSTVSATTSVGTGTIGWNYWQIPTLVQRWVEGSYVNNGILVKKADESVVSLPEFYSRDSTSGNTPSIYVTYQYKLGLRREFSYVSQQLSDRQSLSVNVGNGNLIVKANDLSLPGKNGFDLNLPRYYNGLDSGQTYSMSLANRWNAFPKMGINSNGDVRYVGLTRYEVLFVKNADSSYTTPPGIDATLAKRQDNGYILTFHQTGEQQRFSQYGDPESFQDKNGNQISFAYTGSNITTITDSFNRTTTIAYSGAGYSNQPSSITDPLGHSSHYGYDGSGNLISYTDFAGQVTSYAYNASNLLTQITDPRANATKIAYDASNRVSSITRGLNSAGTCPTGATCPVTSFSYAVAGGTFCTTPTTDVTDPNGHLTRYCYDSLMRVTKLKDALGNTTSTDYTSANGGSNCTDANAYTLDDNPCSTNDALGNKTTYGYDAAKPENKLWSQSPLESASNRPTYAYTDANHPYYPTSFTDARGKLTTYSYDAAGDTTATVLDGTTINQSVYNAAGEVTSSIDGRGKTTTYTYDASGNLASQTDPLGDKTTYTYDGLGRQLTKVDPLGNVVGGNPANYTTSYTYDALGRVLTGTDPLGNTTTHAYDADGNETSLTAASNHVTTSAYDALNRLTSVTRPDPDGAGPLTAPVTTDTYDAASNQVTEVDPRGNVPGGNPAAYTTTSAYDADNRLVSVTTPTGAKTTYGYDANGSLTSTVDPRGNVQGANPADYTTTASYDAGGRLITETDPLGHAITYAYDLAGNQTSETDANNHATSSTYDAAGRVLSVTAPDGGVTSYTYDGNGNELARADPSNHTTTSAYDDASRLATVTGPDPDGAGPLTAPVTTYADDANGNLISTIDPNGNSTQTVGDGKTTSTYDAANRLKTIGYSDSTPGVSFNYDAVGNRTSMTDGSGTVTSVYDGLDRLTSVTRGTDGFSYAYDTSGNVTSSTYPDGTVTAYTYDQDNRLSSAASGGATTSYAYDPAANITQTTLPASNGYVETRSYDKAGRLTEVKNASGGSVLSDFVSTLDPVGNPTTVTQTGAVSGTTTYVYDASDRLTSVCFQASCPGSADPFIRWTYDHVGNRLTETRPSATTTYSYNAADELTSAGATNYNYDQNGNETAAGGRTFSYDLVNRLIATTSGGTTTTYSYDGDGNRLQASTGSGASATTNYLWDANGDLPQLALERDGSNALVRRYVYGVRRLSMMTGGSAYYYAYDALGSVVNMTSATGATEWTYTYEPFGTTRTETQNDPQAPANLMKFAGALADPTGLYYLGARQADPSTGRFLREDPMPPGSSGASSSSYAYASNQPTVLVDPGGTAPTRRCRAGKCPSTHHLVYPFPKGIRKRIVGSGIGPYRVHPTAGLPGYPGIDFGARAGAPVLAVATGRTRWETGPGTSNGGSLEVNCSKGTYGYNFYLKSILSGIEYFYTHLRTRLVRNGGSVVAGQKVGTIVNWGAAPCPKPNHLHLGATGPPSGANIIAVYQAPQVRIGG